MSDKGFQTFLHSRAKLQSQEYYTVDVMGRLLRKKFILQDLCMYGVDEFLARHVPPPIHDTLRNDRTYFFIPLSLSDHYYSGILRDVQVPK